MSDLLGLILEGIGHVLIELANWIPAPRWDTIGAAWAWPIAVCLAVGLIALVAALCLGHPWLYQLTLTAFAGSLGFVCVGALGSRPSRSG